MKTFLIFSMLMLAGCGQSNQKEMVVEFANNYIDNVSKEDACGTLFVNNGTDGDRLILDVIYDDYPPYYKVRKCEQNLMPDIVIEFMAHKGNMSGFHVRINSFGPHRDDVGDAVYYGGDRKIKFYAPE